MTTKANIKKKEIFQIDNPISHLKTLEKGEQTKHSSIEQKK